MDFVPIQPWLEMSGKVEAALGSRLFEIHPTNLQFVSLLFFFFEEQFVSLPMMGFEYVKSLSPIYMGSI